MFLICNKDKMGAGLMQLLFTGQQDIYLKSNPSLTFFKKIFKTHTNFSCESIRLEFNRSDCNVYENTIFKTKILRHADLVSQIYFCIELPDIISDNILNFQWIQNIGEAMIDNYYISIGGSIIDKQSGDFLHAMNCFSISSDKRKLYDGMTGNTVEFYDPEQFQLEFVNTIKPPLRYRVGSSYPSVLRQNIDPANFIPSIAGRKLYIPLQFWFNKDVGNALPLISMQYSEVEITVEIRPITALYRLFYSQKGIFDHYAPINHIDTHKFSNFVANVRQRFMISDNILDIRAGLEVNYIYLDTLERKYFAYKPLEYLIEQVTRAERVSLEENNTLDFILQNPIKEILWFCRRNDVNIRNDWFEFADARKTKIMQAAKILFNGVDRFEEKDSEYFNWLQPFQHHSGTGKLGLYCYSFSLYPEEYQPSGSVNASRINKIQMYLRLKKPSDPRIKYDGVFFFVNYNILRVMSGLASVAYAL